MAAQTILVTEDVEYIMLCLSFGGAPNPLTWCAVLEMIIDLSNELHFCHNWNSEEIVNPAQTQPPELDLLPSDIPFGEARQMAFDIPVTNIGRMDSFIDDLIWVFVNTFKIWTRETQTVPLAVYVINRPHTGEAELIPRHPILSVPKLIVEGTLVEVQIVLGWGLNTRTLTIKLPADKFIAWTKDLKQIVINGMTTFGTLESCNGRLNHINL